MCFAHAPRARAASAEPHEPDQARPVASRATSERARAVALARGRSRRTQCCASHAPSLPSFVERRAPRGTSSAAFADGARQLDLDRHPRPHPRRIGLLRATSRTANSRRSEFSFFVGRATGVRSSTVHGDRIGGIRVERARCRSCRPRRGRRRRRDSSAADLHRLRDVGQRHDRPARLDAVADVELAALPRVVVDDDDAVARRLQHELA